MIESADAYGESYVESENVDEAEVYQHHHADDHTHADVGIFDANRLKSAWRKDHANIDSVMDSLRATISHGKAYDSIVKHRCDVINMLSSASLMNNATEHSSPEERQYFVLNSMVDNSLLTTGVWRDLSEAAQVIKAKHAAGQSDSLVLLDCGRDGELDVFDKSLDGYVGGGTVGGGSDPKRYRQKSSGGGSASRKGGEGSGAVVKKRRKAQGGKAKIGNIDVALIHYFVDHFDEIIVVNDKSDRGRPCSINYIASIICLMKMLKEDLDPEVYSMNVEAIASNLSSSDPIIQAPLIFKTNCLHNWDKIIDIAEKRRKDTTRPPFEYNVKKVSFTAKGLKMLDRQREDGTEGTDMVHYYVEEGVDPALGSHDTTGMNYQGRYVEDGSSAITSTGYYHMNDLDMIRSVVEGADADDDAAADADSGIADVVAEEGASDDMAELLDDVDATAAAYTGGHVLLEDSSRDASPLEALHRSVYQSVAKSSAEPKDSKKKIQWKNKAH